MRTVLAPTTPAAEALRQGRPDAAVEALAAAASTELGTVAGLVPVYMHAEALLRKGAAAEAAREYDKVLQHRGVDPFAPVVPLSYLGLARARARTGDVDGSRRAYQALFTMWQSADRGFWPLAEARREHERLPPSAARAAASAP